MMGDSALYGLSAEGCNARRSHDTYCLKTVLIYSTLLLASRSYILKAASRPIEWGILKPLNIRANVRSLSALAGILLGTGPLGAWKPMACNQCHSEPDPSFANRDRLFSPHPNAERTFQLAQLYSWFFHDRSGGNAAFAGSPGTIDCSWRRAI